MIKENVKILGSEERFDNHGFWKLKKKLYPPPRTSTLYYQLLPDRASNGHALFEAETACMHDIKAGAKRQEGAEIVRDNSRV